MEEENEAKKKIIFVISRMSIGGAQKSLVNVLRTLDYSLYDVSLYVRENKTELLSELPHSVKVTINKNKRRYEHTPYTLFLYSLKRLFAAVKNEKLVNLLENKSRQYIINKKTWYEKKQYKYLFAEHYDIAVSYLQGYTCKFTYDCISADRKICFYHNSTDSLPEIHSEYLRLYEKIAVVSEETKNFLAGRYPDISDHIIVIRNLMNIEEIDNKARDFSVKKEPGITYLCTCGRMSPEKGYDIAAEAAILLKKAGKKFIWFFIGDGPTMPVIENKIKDLKLNENVVLLGLQMNPYPWISQCDIYVQPSYEEAQGLTIMEAQFFGVPVVSTETVGAKSIITNYQTGILCDIDPESLGKGIIKLMDDEALFSEICENTKIIDFMSYNKSIQRQWKNLLKNE